MVVDLPCKLPNPVCLCHCKAHSISTSSVANTLCRCSRRRDVRPPQQPCYPSPIVLHRETPPTDANRPLNASELNVLRAQYEKEGEMVGVQTKFNYAWVRTSSTSWPPSILLPNLTPHTGPRQIQRPSRPTTRCPPPLRHLPRLSRTSPRVPLLPRPRQLQARQLCRGTPLQ